FSSVGIRLIFFDGEEAFQTWSNTDSLYGSRHLAEMWEKEGSDGRTELSKIKLLVLLDLLGASNPIIPNYHTGNAMAYHALLNLESVMSSAGLLLGVRNNDHKYFGSRSNGLIQDDHIPFLYRGVSVLHLIPTPFPTVWHTIGDNATIIDWNVSKDLVNLMEAFVRSFLHLL
ncbi:hypothetical protein EG68_11872, partial [Paragonimus skrjabini miyazakii]